MNTKRGDMPAHPIGIDLIRPTQGEPWPYEYPYGLTIREQFAMAAMQGLLSSAGNPNRKTLSHDEVCEFSVNYADLLLEHLERTK